MFIPMTKVHRDNATLAIWDSFHVKMYILSEHCLFRLGWWAQKSIYPVQIIFVPLCHVCFLFVSNLLLFGVVLFLFSHQLGRAKDRMVWDGVHRVMVSVFYEMYQTKQMFQPGDLHCGCYSYRCYWCWSVHQWHLWCCTICLILFWVQHPVWLGGKTARKSTSSAK